MLRHIVGDARQIIWDRDRNRHRDRPMLGKRLLCEARMLAELDHPGIPNLFDTGVLPDRRPYFTMQVVPGHTLAYGLSAWHVG